jgi:hypothetical protein
MWIGSLRLRVRTLDRKHAGTDNLITATLRRDDEEIETLALDYPTENDLERGAVRNYDYFGPSKLPRNNDETPEFPGNVGQNPPPFPSYGIEFSHGIQHHFAMRLEIHGDDMWIGDKVELFVREIRLKSTSFDTFEWQEDTNWTPIAVWDKNIRMSTDSDEGLTLWDLVF